MRHKMHELFVKAQKELTPDGFHYWICYAFGMLSENGDKAKIKELGDYLNLLKQEDENEQEHKEGEETAIK